MDNKKCKKKSKKNNNNNLNIYLLPFMKKITHKYIANYIFFIFPQYFSSIFFYIYIF